MDNYYFGCSNCFDLLRELAMRKELPKLEFCDHCSAFKERFTEMKFNEN
jgi:hypothetical protein